jgi:hypothetical protein
MRFAHDFGDVTNFLAMVLALACASTTRAQWPPAQGVKPTDAAAPAEKAAATEPAPAQPGDAAAAAASGTRGDAQPPAAVGANAASTPADSPASSGAGATTVEATQPLAGGSAATPGAEAASTQAAAADDSGESPAKDGQPVDSTALVGDPFGAAPGGVQVGFISLRLLAQTRYRASFASASENDRVSSRVIEDYLAQDHDGWNLNRLFLRIGAEPSEYLELKTILDLAEFVHDNANSAVKQGYATIKPWPKRLEITAGLFKLPFSVLELDPIANYEFAELGQADDLVKDLGFAGKDIGAEIAVAPLSKPKHLRIAVGLFRGHSHDEHDSPAGAIGVRIETQPVKGLRFGVDWMEHPQKVVYQQPTATSNRDIVPHPLDPMYPRQEVWDRGRAFSADASYKRKHIVLGAEAMVGTRVDYDTRYGAHTFAAVWVLGGYRFRAGPVHLLPALRAEWLDADREHDTGLRRELSFALNVDFSESIRLLLDVTRSDVQAHSPVLDQPKPLADPPYNELDATRLVAQLQIKI